MKYLMPNYYYHTYILTKKIKCKLYHYYRIEIAYFNDKILAFK